MQLITERLIIRPFNENDLPQFEKLLDIQEVPGWVMQKNRSKDFLQWHISNYEKMDVVNGIVCFGIFDKITGRVLGAVGAGEHDDLHETEIFYNLVADARGKGFATEATAAVIAWVFDNYQLPYIIGTTGLNNYSSQKVLERCGFKKIDKLTLLVHIENKKYDFFYYRHYCAK